MIVSEIFIYPIKSCQGIKLELAEVTPKGFAWDREFMLVDRKGKFLTQRQYPNLARIQVQISGDIISLSAGDTNLKPLIFKSTLTGLEIEVDIWRDQTIAIDQGDEVAEWFQRALQLNLEQKCRLVRQSPKYIRPIDKKYAVREDEPVSFADGYPFLITSTASLVELNRRIREFHKDNNQEVPMNRFRPNIVVNTSEPFIEGEWKLISIGGVKFAVVKPCSRCIITTTDQFTGKRNNLREPLRTLSTFRQFSNRDIMFGENMIPRTTGVVRVGDKVQILEMKVTGD
ncbi:MAG: MOSC domain-containing protein [Xenococcaceae cyanobacterium]